MLGRTFTYKDYNGTVRKETWYFNLDEAELLKMELGSWGGLDTLLKRLMREEDSGKIVDMFEKIILGAVGEKSPDGRKFIKNEAIREDFHATPAYSELFVELVRDPEKVNAFLKGCVPEELAMKMEEREKAAKEEANASALTNVEAEQIRMEIIEGGNG